jgi:glycosyltransferase involved in cell wall biosynthesis
LDARPLLLDVSRLIWRRWIGRIPTGIDRVCLAYLHHYRARSQAVIQRRGMRRILSPGASDRLFELLVAPRRTFRRDIVGAVSRGWLGRRGIDGHGRLYLNVGHTGLEEEAFLRWTRTANVRSVHLVHDLIPITHPEYCRAGEAARHVQRMRHMLASATGIIANSHATLNSLAEFAVREHLPMAPALPALLGTDLAPDRLGTQRDPARPTFVMLGTIEARKNHLMVLQVWLRLIEAMGERAPRLLIIGQRGWEAQAVFDLLDRNATLRGAVTEINQCSDAELTGHLQSARALLFPSLVEGFGLPLAEALTVGTPVVASDLKVFREVGGDVPDYLDPLDAPAWRAAVEDYAAPDSPRRRAQIMRHSRYRRSSWNDHFRSVDAFLEAL